MSDRLEIRTLGGLTIKCSGQPVSGFTSRKSEALLVYLAYTRHPHPREVLAEMFWEERSQAQSFSNLRTTLTSLRQQVGPYVDITRDTVGINLSAPCWLDAAEMEHHLTVLDQYGPRTNDLPHEVVEGLQVATDLYQGDFLEGFYIDSKGFETWALLERERLRFRVMDALDALIAHMLVQGDYSAGIAWATRLLQRDSLREKTHRQLMMLLLQSGQREAALAQYESCRHLLAEELGVEPTAQTTALYEQARAGELLRSGPEVKLIKGYELRERIGAGGFGEVYRAYQPDIGREVAVKVILPQYANQPDFIRRFEAEARIVARLEHPFIVPLYDYWREPGGAYLVMRWLRCSLRERLQQGALTLLETARLIDQIAAALTVAHRNGVVHRDIKPANILLDDEGNAYLSDFGIARDLVPVGETTPLDLLASSPAYQSPEQIAAQPVTPGTDIYSLGIVIYEALTGQHPFPGESTSARLRDRQLSEPLPAVHDVRPDLPAEINEVIWQATAKDPAQRYADVISLATAFHHALPGEVSQEENVGALVEDASVSRGISTRAGEQVVLRNPYKGLRAFGEADAPDFFGREALVDRLVARMAADDPLAKFLAVVGPSGCGKSSAVRAGLIPALRRGALPGSEKWFIAEMLPGAHPFEEVELALSRVAANPVLNLLQLFRDEKRGLLRAVRRLLPEKTTLLLFIDQFEEVFTMVENPGEMAHFLDSLCAVITDPRSPVRVIIALRADFYDRPLMHADFGALISARTQVVLPLTAQEVERAVRMPSDGMHVALEHGLAAAIVAEVNEQPGALPLLQYALTELFDHREDHMLTWQAYNTIGRTVGALAQRIEKIFGSLDDESQEATRQIFLRLVTLGEGIEDTRRRVLLSELLSIGRNPKVMQRVVTTFDRSHLLTFDHDPITRGPTVEVAHEAIIQRWERLREWIDASRADIRQQRLLSTATAEWEQAGRERSYLLSGSRLAQFEGWAGQTDIALTPSECVFLEASITENRRQRALRRRIRNFTLAAAVLISVVMTGLSTFAFSRERRAQDARARAEREASVNHSIVLGNQAQDAQAAGYTDLALALALEAARIGEPPSDVIGILADIAFGDGTRYVIQAHNYSVKDVAISPDERWGLSGSCHTIKDTTCVEGELILWNLETGAEVRRFEGHTGWVNSVAFSPDGQAALSGSADMTLMLWDVTTGDAIHRFEGHTDAVNSAAFSPDGQTVLSGSADTTLMLWDVTTGDAIHRFEGHTDAVNSVAFSPDGQTILSGSADTTLMLWDVSTGKVIHRFEEHPDAVTSVAFSPDGNMVFSGDEGSWVRVYDVKSGEENLDRPHTYGEPITDISISSSGYALFSGTGSYILFDVSDLQDTRRFGGDYLVKAWSGAISTSGQVGLIGATNGMLGLLSLESQAEIRRFGTGVPYFGIAVSPDGRYLLTGSVAQQNGEAALWDLATGIEIRRFTDNNSTSIFDVAFSPDGKYALLAVSNMMGDPDAPSRVVLWDVETGEEVRRFEDRLTGWVLSIAVSPNGRQMLSSSASMAPDRVQGGLILWDVETGQAIRQFTTESTGQVVFSADGSRALSGTYWGADGHISLWDVTTGQEIRRFERGHNPGHAVFCVAFGPGETTIISGSADSTLVEWDIETGKILRRFIGHDGAIWSRIRVSQDGRHMLSASFGDVILWDFRTGGILHHFRGYTNWGNVVFGPDEQTAFSVGGSASDGVIEWKIADMPLDELVEWTYANRYIREFTCDERAQYRIEPRCD